MEGKDKTLLEVLTPLEIDEITQSVCRFAHNSLNVDDQCPICGMKRLTDKILGLGQDKK